MLTIQHIFLTLNYIFPTCRYSTSGSVSLSVECFRASSLCFPVNSSSGEEIQYGTMAQWNRRLSQCQFVQQNLCMKSTELARLLGNDLKLGMANIKKATSVSVSYCGPEREASETTSNSLHTLAYTCGSQGFWSELQVPRASNFW